MKRKKGIYDYQKIKRKKANVKKIVKITRHEESAAADDNSANNSK